MTPPHAADSHSLIRIDQAKYSIEPLTHYKTPLPKQSNLVLDIRVAERLLGANGTH